MISLSQAFFTASHSVCTIYTFGQFVEMEHSQKFLENLPSKKNYWQARVAAAAHEDYAG
jgi:hypothetical protein